MAKRFSPTNEKQRQLRGRWHDYNSQRRYRKQSTLTWEQYKRKTNSGMSKLKRK